MIRVKNKYEYLSGIELKILIAVFAIILGITAFIIIAGFVTKGYTYNFDIRILKCLRHSDNLNLPIGPPWLYEVMRDITSLGGSSVVCLITLSVVGYFILQKQYSTLILILTAFLGGVVMDLELKAIFGRVRPELIPSLLAEKSFSFPSGHSMMSAIIYLSLASLIARMQTRRRDKIYIISIAVCLTFLIGISRVYLGVHYPTDVLGGWSLGLAWAALCWFVAWYISKKRGQETMKKTSTP